MLNTYWNDIFNGKTDNFIFARFLAGAITLTYNYVVCSHIHAHK